MSLNFVRLKSLFLDNPKMMRAAEKAGKTGLIKYGAFVRRRAKSLIKKAPKVDRATGQITRKRKGVALRAAHAKPGQPPYSQRGDLRRLIFFAWEPRSKTVVVGPAAFSVAQSGGKKAPELLEHGGRAVRSRIRTARGGKLGRVATDRQRESFFRLISEKRLERRERQRVFYAAKYSGNPFMSAADLAERPKFLTCFKDSF